MIWVAITRDARSEIGFIDGSLGARKYKTLLQAKLIPFMQQVEHATGVVPVFQHDRATAHTAVATTEWLAEKGIDEMDWPSKGADINPIENILGALARLVYADNRQFASVRELKAAILDCWTRLSQGVIAAAVDSMPHRMVEVVAKHGGRIGY